MIRKQSTIDEDQDMLHFFLGKLFYAIAMADNKITPEEITALKSAILQNWHTTKHPSNESNLEAQHSILAVFNKLRNTRASSADCFMEFRVFFLEHQSVFNTELRKLVWHTAQAIASSFAKKNKSELVLLAKLKILLET